MTLAYERRRALELAGEALRAIRHEGRDLELWGAPLPTKLRDHVVQILRHYPTPQQIEAATAMEDVPVSSWIASEPSGI
jgi:hypothetical protein